MSTAKAQAHVIMSVKSTYASDAVGWEGQIRRLVPFGRQMLGECARDGEANRRVRARRGFESLA
jgi:hypothetical protein